MFFFQSYFMFLHGGLMHFMPYVKHLECPLNCSNKHYLNMLKSYLYDGPTFKKWYQKCSFRCLKGRSNFFILVTNHFRFRRLLFVWIDISVFSTASAELCVKKSKKVDSTNDEWALAVPKLDIRGMLRHYRDLRDRELLVLPLSR